MTTHERMIQLWTSWLQATTDYERGYYAGRFEEYAFREWGISPYLYDIDPDAFPAYRRIVGERLRAGIRQALDADTHSVRCDRLEAVSQA